MKLRTASGKLIGSKFICEDIKSYFIARNPKKQK